MAKSISFLGGLAMSASLLAPAWAEQSGDLAADRVVAVVNGTEITLGHMILTRAALPQNLQQQSPDMLFPGILEQLIQQTALQQAFNGELSMTSRMLLENEQRKVYASEVVQEVLTAAVTPEKVQAAYDAAFEAVEEGKEYSASHILVPSELEAKAIKDDLDNGADFAQMAKERSTGPSGPRGGSLGWFSEGMMVPQFEKAVLGMEIGEVSNPVETRFGWHVIKLEGVRKKNIPTLDQIRPQIEDRVRQEAVQAEIDRLLEDAKVERLDAGIDASVLLNMQLLD